MDERIQRTLKYIESNLTSTLTLEELARVALMSQSHFHKVFKKATGMTPFKYIEDLKMKRAYELLLNDSTKVNELAALLGYNDYETFSRCFKKHYAIAPDDMKAIAEKIITDIDIDPKNLIFKKYEIETLSELKEILAEVSSKVVEILIERGYSEKDIKDARVFPVLPKGEGIKNNSRVIKNKYVIDEHPIQKNQN